MSQSNDRWRKWGAAALVAAAFGTPRFARADGIDITPPADKSVYNLFNPTPRDQMRDMNTDRPDTTESPITVDAGHYQLELSFADFVYDRRSRAHESTHTLAVAPMLLKVGLLNNVDVQLGIDPYTWSRVRDRTTGERTESEGFGDTLMRVKINLWGNDGGDTALAIMPFVTFPTATGGVGAKAVEGGLIVPLSLSLPYEFDLTVMAEFDFNRSGADDRYVVDFVHSASLGHKLIGDLNGFIEYAGFANWNHDEGYRGYLNTGVTYGLTKDIQLDCGARVGLTKAAEDVGVFAGISLRL